MVDGFWGFELYEIVGKWEEWVKIEMSVIFEVLRRCE